MAVYARWTLAKMRDAPNRETGTPCKHPCPLERRITFITVIKALLSYTCAHASGSSGAERACVLFESVLLQMLKSLHRHGFAEGRTPTTAPVSQVSVRRHTESLRHSESQLMTNGSFFVPAPFTHASCSRCLML